MTIDILTLFPAMFEGPFNESIIKRAQKKGMVKINIHNLRDWAKDKHKITDDTPYGGGVGMVMKVNVIDHALRDLKFKTQNLNLKSNSNLLNLKIKNLKLSNQPYVILLTPQGRRFDQKLAKKLSKKDRLILLCGHYEGVDERVRNLVDEQISIGDYVLTGGELPAMVITDAIVRLLPGVLGKKQSHQIESFSMNGFISPNNMNLKLKIKNLNLPSCGWLEYPQYTRPQKYQPISKLSKKPLAVPKILLSGNHQKIKDWRISQSIKKSFGRGCQI